MKINNTETDIRMLRATIKMWERRYKTTQPKNGTEALRLLELIERYTTQYIELTNDLPNW